MANGYSRSPKLLKGALIRFDSQLLIPIPNIIIFQYNPETMTRTLTPYAPAEDGGEQTGVTRMGFTDLTQPFDPQESFSLRLIFDVADQLESPETHPIHVVTGIATSLSALEMLLYPESAGGGLLGSISGSLSASVGGFSASADGAAGAEVPDRKVPVALFFWGPGRIVPVRLTGFSIEEQAYSPLLYPIRAVVSVSLTVVTPDRIREGKGEGDLSMAESIAIGAYEFTMAQKQILATANLVNSVESILNMLPI
ncbi:MAG: hypothetical protein IPK19_00875 [Chloroflexi bacterium]|nr:hypothetical protein [Chloroflexota bacterium]